VFNEERAGIAADSFCEDRERGEGWFFDAFILLRATAVLALSLMTGDRASMTHCARR
jgi:hypothetical protein